jgi:segregation and condensation protein A
MQVFNRLLDKMNNENEKVVHRIFDYDYTIEEQSAYISTMLDKRQRVDFKDLFSTLQSRVHAIVTFLALLEMASQQRLSLTLGEGVNNFWISKRTSNEEE